MSDRAGAGMSLLARIKALLARSLEHHEQTLDERLSSHCQLQETDADVFEPIRDTLEEIAEPHVVELETPIADLKTEIALMTWALSTYAPMMRKSP